MFRRIPSAFFALVSLLLVTSACDCGNDPTGPGDGDGGPDGTVNPGDGGPDADGAVQAGCGNAVLDPGEDCDYAAAGFGDGCTPTCMFAPGWDCFENGCIPAECGDGVRVGGEGCDDGNQRSGDGCSLRCTVEPSWVCITPGFPCRQAVCGDGAVEAQEQCDDGDTQPNDGCDANCRLQSGWHCPTPGMSCMTASCGDGVRQGLEQCDDANAPTPGCDANCQLEPDYHCPTPGAACVPTSCGDGLRQGLEGCDDGDLEAGDGCDASCVVEGFYECTGDQPSLCKKPVEFVRIAKFPAPMQQPQAVHYDPRTRSFVAYGFDAAQGVQEVCLDGTQTDVRETQLVARRALVGGSLDGAAYDAFNDTFLFVRQNGQITEINRSNQVVNQVSLTGLGTAGGVQVGDDGRIYATNHFAPGASGSPGAGLIRIYRRNANGSIPMMYEATIANSVINSVSEGNYLDNLFVIPGLGWIGYYTDPDDPVGGPESSDRAFIFHRYDGTVVGVSQIPGLLFRNGERFPHNADGGEAAVDGGYFLVCSEYLTEASYPAGFCQLFARTCETDFECANRVPGTVCKTDESIPYCYAPAYARDDRFTVLRDSSNVLLDVLRNDSLSEAVCLGNAATITSSSAGDHGGTITIADAGARVSYTPQAGMCGFVETFTYDANLGGTATDTARVQVSVVCVCGNNVTESGEQCDDGNTAAGDGCGPTCRIEGACGNGTTEPGEQCDDGGIIAGDGCSPTCTVEIF